ncbi:hypothetical protein EIP86_000112 [Pleurotus ostreatoroseus]|nr:hypothetical protein EIP86_000112 [Pleurotus ostreatoroseus]
MPESLTYTVRPLPPALRDLSAPLQIPNRSPQLPPIYLWEGQGPHPQRLEKGEDNGGRTYIIIIDGSDDGKHHADRLAQLQNIPLGRNADVQGQGDANTTIRGLDEEKARLTKARDAILGPREERTTENVRFERSARAKRSRGNDRAYGIGEMVQLSRKVEAPAAASKVYEGELDEDQTIQKEFLEAAANVMVKTYTTTAPIRWQVRTQEYSEVINGPKTGCDDNYWFPSFQLNIAPAQDGDSDLPEDEGVEPGRFHFLSHGFYVRLETFYAVYFSGRLLHGGTAPLAAPGRRIPSWAYRCVLIGYPPKYIMEGDIRHTLAALPHRAEPLYITPEMTGVK